jgi:hypothetical protein
VFALLLRFMASVYTFVFSLLRFTVSVHTFVFSLLRFTASVYTFVFSLFLRFAASVYTFVFSLVWFTASVYTFVFSLSSICGFCLYLCVLSPSIDGFCLYLCVLSPSSIYASVYTFGIFTLFLLLQSLYGIKINIPKIFHKTSWDIPELTVSKSDPLNPYTIVIDTDWNINNLRQFFPVIAIFSVNKDK